MSYPQSTKDGFTAIELIVVIAIITLISSTVLVSFSGLNQGIALQRGARELALATRRAQNRALAVSQLRIGGVDVIPPAVGIFLTTGSTNFKVFADLADPVSGLSDKHYTSSSEDFETATFDRSIQIQALKGYPGGEATPAVNHDTANILFSSPDGTMNITDENGSNALIGERLDVVLVAPNGQTKTMIVRITGQIDIK